LSDAALVPWRVVRNTMADLRQMRFCPGPVRRGCTGKDKTGFLSDDNRRQVMESWCYALDMLRTRTSKPLVLVFVPEVPVLQKGKVCCANAQSQWSRRLRDLAARFDIGYIDMTEPLIADYQETGRLSRGFHNGVPGQGHLNARGHALLARAIATYLCEGRIIP